MATYTADAAQAGVQPKGLRVGMFYASGIYTAPSNWSTTIGTTIEMIKVPAGATPVFVQYGTTQAGDHTFSVGDGANNARYKTDGTCTAGLGMVTCTIPAGTPYTYSTDDTIDIYISLVSESSLGGSWYVNAIFTMDP